MDVELKQATGQVRSAILAMQHREKRLKNTTTKLSLHYTRLAHTTASVELLQEILGMLMQDPDLWTDEEPIIPF